MKELAIEWRHLEIEGKTCVRCAETGRALDEVLIDLKEELAAKGIAVILTEVMLPESEIAQSNMILFNGMALEDALPEIRVSENECHSCSCITGNTAYCRTIEYEGTVYEEIPESIIYKAAYNAINLER